MTLTALVGLLLLLSPIGGGVTLLSYDLPFSLRHNLPVNDAVVIHLEESDFVELNQPRVPLVLTHSFHARLVDRLTAAGAKAIVFDMLFTDASDNPEADAQFAAAIKKSGRVILAGNYNTGETTPGAEAKWEEIPYEPFRAGIVAWGNDNFLIDPDYGVRRCFPNLENISGQAEVPWMPLAVARFVNPSGRQTYPSDAANAWLNYCGPPGAIPNASYYQALQPDGVPPDFFKDKIVFIGGRFSAELAGKGKDDFRTPYSYWREGFAPGVEIHATATLNLLHNTWLSRLPPAAEIILVLLVAAGAGFGLMRFRPLAATLVAFAGIFILVAVACALVWREFIWFGWIIQIFEIGVALVCSVIFNSLRLYVEKRLMEQSLGSHLSLKIAKRIISDPAARQVGGSLQEVSILFTDIANFSRISESMNPDDLVRLMNKYFETALRCIHETDGTVVKLIGDAIFAIWNAPVTQPDHRERASLAALRLREQLVEFDAAERSLPLRTRAGLHSGEACVGNIGSTTRFDYTAIGDSINLTSRLEGLNKQLGTDVLATREIQRAGEKSLVWRLVGHFKFKGFGRAVEVHELVGPLESAEQSSAWRGKFSDALQDFRQRNFDGAAVKFQAVIELRRVVKPDVIPGTSFIGGDGPSRFYLEKIAALRANPPPYEWIGEVILDEK